MESIKFCEATPKQVQAVWRIGLSVGLGVYAVLAGAGLVLIHRRVPLLLSYRLYTSLARLVPALTLVGTVAFLADAQKERHSLITCDSWTGVQWVAFLVHLCFLVRLLLNWGVTFRPQLVATVVDVWLFMQACVALYHGLTLYAFTFITLIRFFHSECLMAWSRLTKLTRSGFGLVLAILVVAGALQMAEEQSSLYGTHPTSQGTLQPIRSFWTYVYWTVVTVSTVGYGEITPSTDAGKTVAVVVVVAGALWFITYSAKVGLKIKQYFREFRYPPPETSHPRIIVLGESDPNNLARLLKLVKIHHISELEVILLVPGEATSRYVWLSSFLPIKVVPCTCLQEDLTNLLPAVDNKWYSNARQHDAVVFFGDHEAEDPEAEDVRVLQLLVQAREFVPDRRFIVQVLLSRSRQAVQQTPCWSERDEVVCLEELSVDMLAQAAACSAAAPVISSLLTAPATYTGGEREDLHRVHHFEETYKIHLQEPREPVFEAEDFVKAALKLYEEKGELLLGWSSPETKDFEILPNELPPGVQWVVISPNAAPPLLFTPKGLHEDYCGDPETVSVAVSGVEPGRGALEAVLHEFPGVRLLPEEEWRSASTVVVTTAGMGLSYVIEAHYLRTRVMREVAEASETKRIRFVADVPHGQGQRAWDQRTTTDVVNKSMVVSAVVVAILDSQLYNIWRRLAAKRNLLGVRVMTDCIYGDAFRTLLLEKRLLALGVEIVREDCLCSTNPPALLPLARGDLLLCFQMPLGAADLDSPPIVISPAIAHSSAYASSSTTHLLR